MLLALCFCRDRSVESFPVSLSSKPSDCEVSQDSSPVHLPDLPPSSRGPVPLAVAESPDGAFLYDLPRKEVSFSILVLDGIIPASRWLSWPFRILEQPDSVQRGVIK